MRWHAFADDSPELAALVREWIVDRHVMMLGTLRADGSPRISVVECDIGAGDLFTGMIWRSTKDLDLVRDPRLTVHSVPPGKDNPAGDLKLFGRAVRSEGAAKRAYEDALQARLNWRPPEPYNAWAIDITAAGLVRFTNGGREVIGWKEGRGTTKRFIKDAY